MIFVRNGGNRRKTNARASLLCGEVRGIFLFDNAVKAVGGNNVKTVSVLQLDGQAVKTLICRKRLTAMADIFQKISQEAA